MTWDCYDVFLTRSDLAPEQRGSAEADTGVDAITRPTLPYNPPDRGWGHEGHPALGVTYYAAQQYCRWLSQKTGRRYRLPSVAEWQSACGLVRDEAFPDIRPAGATRPAAALAAEAWSADNADEQAHPVARKSANAHGLYDMLGNVAEWCTAADGKTGVACGGSFQTPADRFACDLVERQQPAWNASDPSFPRSRWWLADAAVRRLPRRVRIRPERCATSNPVGEPGRSASSSPGGLVGCHGLAYSPARAPFEDAKTRAAEYRSPWHPAPPGIDRAKSSRWERCYAAQHSALSTQH